VGERSRQRAEDLVFCLTAQVYNLSFGEGKEGAGLLEVMEL